VFPSLPRKYITYFLRWVRKKQIEKTAGTPLGWLGGNKDSPLVFARPARKNQVSHMPQSLHSVVLCFTLRPNPLARPWLPTYNHLRHCKKDPNAQDSATRTAARRDSRRGTGGRISSLRLSFGHRTGHAGWVSNSPQGVFLEVEGAPDALRSFLLRLERERPPRSSIQSLEPSFLSPIGFHTFEIRPSDHTGERTALVLPDIATCADCLREIWDPVDRRYRYPFTNCTNCGPRFSIIQALPYDRPNTTMAGFAMCGACRREYENRVIAGFTPSRNACPPAARISNCGACR